MNILKDVLSELFSMFVADARLTASILATVAISALLIEATRLPAIVGGAALLSGCIAVLLLSVRREAKRRAPTQSVSFDLCRRLLRFQSADPNIDVNLRMKWTTVLDRLRVWARAIKRDVVALYLATRDLRVPWLAKIFAACVVAYTLSPIDLIPDFIPVLGYLDDAILVPLGILLAVRLVPVKVMADLRTKADRQMALPKSRAAAITVVAIWLAAATASMWWIYG